jgi:hypothetical protein
LLVRSSWHQAGWWPRRRRVLLAVAPSLASCAQSHKAAPQAPERAYGQRHCQEPRQALLRPSTSHPSLLSTAQAERALNPMKTGHGRPYTASCPSFARASCTPHPSSSHPSRSTPVQLSSRAPAELQLISADAVVARQPTHGASAVDALSSGEMTVASVLVSPVSWVCVYTDWAEDPDKDASRMKATSVKYFRAPRRRCASAPPTLLESLATLVGPFRR